jgi:hypothetical protein
MIDDPAQSLRSASAESKIARVNSALPHASRVVTIIHRMSREWLPTIAWSIRRTGQRGLIGIALLAAAGVFFLSTHWPLVTQVQSMHAELQESMANTARLAVQTTEASTNDPRHLLESLPARIEIPKLLGVILTKADTAGLSIDTGKYDVVSTRTGNITRYNVSFPVSGTYPQVRSFIDHFLRDVPTASLSELAIERKSIADGTVEASVRLALFTKGQP